MNLDHLNVRTSSAEVFSGMDSALLAALILIRFGRDPEAGAEAWRRLLGNSCSDTQFRTLARAGLPLVGGVRRGRFSGEVGAAGNLDAEAVEMSPPREADPFVCPGCLAFGEEPCSPGCIDAELARDAEARSETGEQDDGERGCQE